MCVSACVDFGLNQFKPNQREIEKLGNIHEYDWPNNKVRSTDLCDDKKSYVSLAGNIMKSFELIMITLNFIYGLN